MKKALSILFVLLLCLSVLSGCAQNPGLDPEDPVTLSIWHVYGSQTESPLNDAIDQFNQTVGKESGVIINVVSVTSSSAIDEALLASVSDAPGAVSLPDLFTAYPRVVEMIGTEKLLNWKDYLSQEELDQYVDAFLTEGDFDGQILMLPIAKSTELFFLNQTLYDRFTASVGKTFDLSTFEGIFAACQSYFDWSEGQNLFQINDFYHYFLAGTAAFGGNLIADGKIDAQSDAFLKAYQPMAEAAIHGGLCMADGYASDRWKTAEILSNVGSSAGILYLRDYVTYPDNTTEDVQTSVLPYPVFEEGDRTVVQRGTGLFAIRSEDERKNLAAACFAKWITNGQQNLDFVTHSGYLPVTESSFESLLADTGAVENEKYRMVYDAASSLYRAYAFCPLPLYPGAGEMQSSFEKLIKSELSAAHEEYLRRTDAGEDPAAVCAELSQSSLVRIQNTLK